jgi:hypothetical protein
MLKLFKRPDAPKTAAELAEMMFNEGFSPGAPPGVPPRTVGLDARQYSRCPYCKSRGRGWRPNHNAAGVYRAISQCYVCGHAEEC